MNEKLKKFGKVILATLAGANVVFDFFTPIAIALIIIILFPNLSSISKNILSIVACMASLFRAVKYGFIKKNG